MGRIQDARRRVRDYTMPPDFCAVFNDDLDHLYTLSLLLTADHQKAEQCFVAGLEDCLQGNPGGGMRSQDFIFWEVDVQVDFMLPGGKLYVPGAEKLLPNIRRLTDAARRDEVFLVSHGCFHPSNDPEFKQFPPHCLKGSAGAEFLPEALTDNCVRIENDPALNLPEDLSKYQQIVLEKQTLDIFQSHHADALVERLGSAAEFVVFGVVTEYCVSYAVKGLLQRKRRVAVVRDAIETVAAEVGEKTLAEFRSLGARVVTTDEVLAEVARARNQQLEIPQFVRDDKT
ncbi:MAG TPA: isochorismatase family cysteine hydrolase [Terriglobales bacterium]|nr:isochorismatase family cysteine hydrolase [Terriglobales bacterium]